MQLKVIRHAFEIIFFSGTTVFGSVMDSLLRLQQDPQHECNLDLLSDYEIQTQVSPARDVILGMTRLCDS